jgi:hypothetical protein
VTPIPASGSGSGSGIGRGRPVAPWASSATLLDGGERAQSLGSAGLRRVIVGRHDT